MYEKQKNMNAFESNIVDQELNSLFSSDYIEEKIKEALKLSFSEFNQKILQGIQDIAESIVEAFKESLKKELKSASNNWIDSQNLLEIVPNGTRYLGSCGSGKICVVEYHPTLKTLRFETDSNGEKGGIFRLAFPYIVFIVRLMPSYGRENLLIVDRMHIGYRNKPLKSLNDKIYCVNLPNCDIDNHVCLGRAWDKISDELKSKDSSLSCMVEGVIGYFWNSTFNDDLTDTFVSCSRSNGEIENLKIWQENSTKNPLFILNLDWGNGISLSEFLYDNRDLRLNVGVIVDRVLIEAAHELNCYLKTVKMTIGNQKSLKALNIMKKALHGSMLAACGRILSSSKKKPSKKVIEKKQLKIGM